MLEYSFMHITFKPLITEPILKLLFDTRKRFFHLTSKKEGDYYFIHELLLLLYRVGDKGTNPATPSDTATIRPRGTILDHSAANSNHNELEDGLWKNRCTTDYFLWLSQFIKNVFNQEPRINHRIDFIFRKGTEKGP